MSVLRRLVIPGPQCQGLPGCLARLCRQALWRVGHIRGAGCGRELGQWRTSFRDDSAFDHYCTHCLSMRGEAHKLVYFHIGQADSPRFLQGAPNQSDELRAFCASLATKAKVLHTECNPLRLRIYACSVSSFLGRLPHLQAWLSSLRTRLTCSGIG